MNQLSNKNGRNFLVLVKEKQTESSLLAKKTEWVLLQ